MFARGAGRSTSRLLWILQLAEGDFDPAVHREHILLPVTASQFLYQHTNPAVSGADAKTF